MTSIWQLATSRVGIRLLSKINLIQRANKGRACFLDIFMTVFYFIFSKCFSDNSETLTCFLPSVSHQRVVEMLSFSIVYISNKRKPQNASLISPTTHFCLLIVGFFVDLEVFFSSICQLRRLIPHKYTTSSCVSRLLKWRH